MIPEFFGKILNQTYKLFKSKGYFINPLLLIEAQADGVGATVKYGDGGRAVVTFQNGLSGTYTLQNSGHWELTTMD